SYQSVHTWLEDNRMTNLPVEDEMKDIELERDKYKEVLAPVGAADQNGLQQAGNKETKTPPKE
ncbi:hypothetical protein, partial [Enterobacter cloacae]|uniref:hypothetical protein n=1 Tax=Enterobacter cloacae TaxID=550 RepID=UPI0021D133E6